MIPDVVGVQVLSDTRLWLRFDDGAEGEVDLAALVGFDGVFAPLRDPAVLAAVRVDPDLGTVVWPSGADVDPLVLYAAATGRRIEDLAPAVAR